jgi:SAM-dependent methyltransferase
MALKEEGRHWKPELYRQRMDPTSDLQEELKQLIAAPPDSVVRILDVGAGPFTTVGKQWEGRLVEITAVDPLAEGYAEILSRLGIRPPVGTVFAHGEKLLELFSPEYFDLAHASNALDHSYDPLLAIEQMLAVVKPGCHVYLWHFANEGITAGYRGLHQWNFDARQEDMVISDGRREYSLAQRFEDVATVHCRSDLCAGKPVVVAFLKKLKSS